MTVLNNRFKLANAVLIAALVLALPGCGDSLSDYYSDDDTPTNGDNGGDTGGDTGGDSGSGSDLIVFTDSENTYWPAWDCCGGTTPTTPVETGDYGLVTEFTLGAQPAVLGFIRADTQGPLDVSAYESTGSLQFDLKVTNNPTAGATNWFFKLESNGGIQNGATGEEVEIQITAPVLNAWQTVTVSLAELANAGLDLSSIDNILIYPQWETGDGAIYRVDNVQFVTDIGGDTGGDTGGSTELLANGDFESGATGWTGNAANPIDDAGNNVNFANVEQAGNAWDVNLSQVLAITPGETYQLSFRAKSAQSRGIIAGIGENHDPFGSATEAVQLTPDWATYTLTLTADGFGDNDCRVLFDMGAEAGEVYLDDVSLTVPASDDTGGDSDGGTGDDETVTHIEGIDFESKTLTWEVFENGDNTALEFIANPATDGINTSNTVAQITALAAGAPWAGMGRYFNRRCSTLYIGYQQQHSDYDGIQRQDQSCCIQAGEPGWERRNLGCRS